MLLVNPKTLAWLAGSAPAGSAPVRLQSLEHELSLVCRTLTEAGNAVAVDQSGSLLLLSGEKLVATAALPAEVLGLMTCCYGVFVRLAGGVVLKFDQDLQFQCTLTNQQELFFDDCKQRVRNVSWLRAKLRLTGVVTEVVCSFPFVVFRLDNQLAIWDRLKPELRKLPCVTTPCFALVDRSLAWVTADGVAQLNL